MLKKKTNKKHSIRFTTLDGFIDIEQCNFLKIDVELMELNVLKGAKILLKSSDQLFGLKIIESIQTL